MAKMAQPTAEPVEDYEYVLSDLSPLPVPNINRAASSPLGFTASFEVADRFRGGFCWTWNWPNLLADWLTFSLFSL